jgi:cytochrome c
MDSWEWNKIAGAVLGVLLFILAVHFIAEAVTTTPLPKKAGYKVDVPEDSSQTAAAPAAAEPLPDFGTVLPSADVAHGKDLASRCQQCHDDTKGGLNRIGPSLWGLVDRPRATTPGYSYSSAMSANHDPWTYDKLFTYLRAPNTDVPGSKMSYAGGRSPQDRIDLLAYLRTLADTPAPIPAKK